MGSSVVLSGITDALGFLVFLLVASMFLVLAFRFDLCGRGVYARQDDLRLEPATNTGSADRNKTAEPGSGTGLITR